MTIEIKKRISIIIPVFNEELAIGQVIRDILENYATSEIIVVDDGSTDNTETRLKEFNVKVKRHEHNKGYGAALKTGIKEATEDIIVTIDSDGEHSAKDIGLLLDSLDNFKMIVGKRINRFPVKLSRRVCKYILQTLADLAVGFKIPDINSGLRVFNKNIILKYLDFLPDGFSFHATSTLAFIFNKHKVKYIPIKIHPRRGKSKVNLKSGFNSLNNILKVSLIFSPLRGILLLLYLLAMGLYFAFILCLFISKNHFFVPLLTPVLLFTLSLVLLNIFSKCNKDLVLDTN